MCHKPVIIGLPPDRSNIKHAIRPVVPILHLCNQLNDGTFIATKCYAKNYIFCRPLQHCATFFAAMKRLLGNNLTKPPEVRPTLGVCLVDVFTSDEMREIVLKEF